MRRNTYDAATGAITLSPERAEAVRQVVAHYTGLFGNDASLDKLREQYAMNAGSLPDAETCRRCPPSSSGRPGRPPPTVPAKPT